MKKIITICSLMAFLIFSANAQTTKKEKRSSAGVSWGVKAGMNLSNITVTQKSSDENYTSLAGITGGGFASIPLSHSLALQPELNYSNMGTNFSSKGFLTISGKISTTYLSIPLLAKYTDPKGGFGMYAGPQLSLLTGAKIKSEGKSEDAKDLFKNSDYLAVAGADYTFPAGLHIDFRYQLGLSNVAKDADPGQSIKNNAFTITAGWVFPSRRNK